MKTSYETFFLLFILLNVLLEQIVIRKKGKYRTMFILNNFETFSEELNLFIKN